MCVPCVPNNKHCGLKWKNLIKQGGEQLPPLRKLLIRVLAGLKDLQAGVVVINPREALNPLLTSQTSDFQNISWKMLSKQKGRASLTTALMTTGRRNPMEARKEPCEKYVTWDDHVHVLLRLWAKEELHCHLIRTAHHHQNHHCHDHKAGLWLALWKVPPNGVLYDWLPYHVPYVLSHPAFIYHCASHVENITMTSFHNNCMTFVICSTFTNFLTLDDCFFKRLVGTVASSWCVFTTVVK